MAMNGGAKIIAVLLSLLFSVFGVPDYYHHTTPRHHSHPHMSDVASENGYSDPMNSTLFLSSMDNSRNPMAKRRQQVDDNPIIYPDTKHLQQSCLFGLCVNVSGYPKEQIQKILSRSQFMNGFFEASEESVVIDNRFNTDEMTLCETKVHTIYPEKAVNTMKIEKVIVNVEGHKQGIVFETCVNNGPCKFSSSFPSGYTSYCKQKYIHKRLMVLGDGDKFVFDSFEVPSCCVCTVTRTE